MFGGSGTFGENHFVLNKCVPKASISIIMRQININRIKNLIKPQFINKEIKKKKLKKKIKKAKKDVRNYQYQQLYINPYDSTMVIY